MPTKGTRRGLEGNMNVKVNTNIFALNYTPGHEIYGKDGT
jgi:hypothetical protein